MNSDPNTPRLPTMREAAKITCEVDKSLATQTLAALAAAGVEHAQVHPRRWVVLSERAPLAFLPAATRLEEDPAEVYEIYVPRPLARGAVLAWAREIGLFTPGRGSIYVEEVGIVNAVGLDMCNPTCTAAGDAGERPGERLGRLALVNCVVQRGRGNRIARSAIETGSNVPSVNFGIGTGVRDRLGLLRIAIPADKEIVSLLVEPEDQDTILDMLIDVGRLHQPGRGFIAAYPVVFGIANPKSFRGRQRHSATMDQVISAIDELKSGTEWRRRAGLADAASRTQRRWLTNLVNVTLNCNEGNADRLLAAAMQAGAGGATISKSKLFSPHGKEFAISPAREVIDFGIGQQELGALIRTLNNDGAFDADVGCFVETKSLPTAFTYTAS